MAPQALVENNLTAGERFLNALDEARLGVYLALWWWHDESDEYRFVLAADALHRGDLRAAYQRLGEILRDAKLENDIPLSRVQLLDRDDSITRGFQRLTRTSRDACARIRITRSTIGDIWIDDALVYRAAMAKPVK